MTTFAEKVRAALGELTRESDVVPASALADALGLDNYKAKRPMYSVIKDMRERGELVQAGQKGVYRFTPVKKTFLRTVMWRVLRSRQKVTVEDLQELAGASKSYAQEWLNMLERREIIKRMKGRAGLYRLIEDVVVEPVNTDRIEKLKNWRRQRKEALLALDQASVAIDRARDALKK